MNILRFPALVFTVLVIILQANAWAINYPQRPIRMLVPYPPGGGVDLAARVIAQKLTHSLGQQVIVDNRPGAAGNIAMGIASRSQPDGYTVIMSAAGPVAINVTLYSKVPFDPIVDFTPVALVASTVYALVTNPSTGSPNLNELIVMAKNNPGKLTFASASTGTPTHLAGELFKSMAKIDIIHVPYRGTAPALTDLLGGHVTMFFCDAIAAASHIKSLRLHGIAVSSPRRFAPLQELPTLSESGLPGFAATGWTGLLAPAKTPAVIIQSLNTEVKQALTLPDVKEKLAGDGREFGKNTPEQFAAWINQETKKWAKVIRESGAKAE